MRIWGGNVMCHLLKTHRGGVDLSPLPLVHTWVLKQQSLIWEPYPTAEFIWMKPIYYTLLSKELVKQDKDLTCWYCGLAIVRMAGSVTVLCCTCTLCLISLLSSPSPSPSSSPLLSLSQCHMWCLSCVLTGHISSGRSSPPSMFSEHCSPSSVRPFK